MKAGITELASICRRNRVASKSEEAESSALEAVRHLLAAAAELGEIVAVARALENRELLLGGPAGERIARTVVERDELRLALVRDRKGGDELGQRLGIGETARNRVGRPRRRLARHQRIASEGLAREEDAARQAERGVESSLKGALEARELDSEIVQQALRHFAVLGKGGIDRFAAAVADDQTPIDVELVALGMAAEIVVIVEDEDARGRAGAAIEPGRCQPADAAADHDQVVALLDRQPVEGETPACARQRVRDLERAVVLAAQSGERGRIAHRRRHDLRRDLLPGREPARDR